MKFATNYLLKKNSNPENLPPTEDALIQYIRRVSYQVFIWKNAIHPMNNMPSPVGNGWKKQDGYLVPNYLTKDHSPKNIENLMTCKCTIQIESTCTNSKQWTSSTTCDEDYDDDCNSEYEKEDDDDKLQSTFSYSDY